MKAKKIRKLDAALRQLDEAIRMFFDERDMIAVHTVASAAEGILYDVAERRKTAHLYDFIKADKRKEFVTAVRRSQNFFKHADRDPDEILDYYPDQGHFRIFSAMAMTVTMGIPMTPEREVFWGWFITQYLEVINWEAASPELKKVREWALEAEIDPMDPMNLGFFRDVLLIHKSGVKMLAV